MGIFKLRCPSTNEAVNQIENHVENRVENRVENKADPARVVQAYSEGEKVVRNEILAHLDKREHQTHLELAENEVNDSEINDDGNDQYNCSGEHIHIEDEPMDDS